MLQDIRYDIFCRDQSCVFGITSTNNESFKLISSKNFRYEQPSNEPWSIDGKYFDVVEGRISTKMSLAGKSANITFITSFSIDKSSIPKLDITKRKLKQGYADEEIVSSAKICIFRQGSDNIDGLVDSYLNLAECTDGILCEVVFKIYYQRTSTINVQRFSYELDESLINENINISFSINSLDYFAELYVNGDLKKSYALDISHTLDLPLNVPFTKSKENFTLAIGDTKKALHLRSALVLNRYVNSQYIKNIKKVVS